MKDKWMFGMEQENLQFGKLHDELGTELNNGMKKLRAQLLSYVEMLGLPESQEQSFKKTVKEATSDFWGAYEELLSEKLVEFGNPGKEKDEKLL